ncbi:MAG: hypothetical protein K6E51_02750 [Treponema sp.]|nr:hypothetical protein [Treponema sp.]
MITIFCLILLIWSIEGLCSDYDHENERKRDYRRAERRHKEMLEVMKNRKRVTRTLVRDKHGRIIAQETIEYYDDKPDFEIE